MKYHKPVLLQSACHFLDVRPGGQYIDCTLGGGGHALEIIKLGGQVLGLDQDPEALAACPQVDGLTKVQTNFIHLQEVAQEYHWQPDGILLDLGISSHQIDTASRGFSFQKSGPLDMRMDPTLSHSAADLVNHLSVSDLAMILRDFGEIPNAKTLAAKIVFYKPFLTTIDLAKITGKYTRQVFQALRIAVNDELGALGNVLPQALEILKSKGIIVVISFHSLEDRIVKQTFQDWAREKVGVILTPKPVVPDPEEINTNPRAKSAKLRSFQKI